MSGRTSASLPHRAPTSGRGRPAALAALTVLTGFIAVTTSGCGGSPSDQLDLVESGALTVCTHVPNAPFQIERAGQIVGFDVDVMNLVANRLDLEQRTIQMPSGAVASGIGLNNSRCDVVASGLAITEERRRLMDFSDPYLIVHHTLFVRKGSGIRSLDDARGHRVGVQQDTTSEEYAKAGGVRAETFRDSDAQLAALRAGRLDAVIQDGPVVNHWLTDARNRAEFEIAHVTQESEQYGYAVRRSGNHLLLRMINQTLDQTKADGSYLEIVKRWMGEVPRSPMPGR